MSDIKKISKQLLKTIQDTPVSDIKTRYRLPKAQDVGALTDALRRILLFDYEFNTDCGGQCATCADAENKLAEMIEKAYAMLLCAVSAVLPENEARRAADEYFEKLDGIRRLTVTDIDAAFDGDPAADNKDLIAIVYPGFYAVSVHRLAHALKELSVPMIPRLMSEYAHGKTGIDIHPGATIGKRFFIDHGTGVVIGETSEIGDNVKIYQGVTLGALSTRKGQGLRGKKRHPTLENNVTVYGNATILGGETVIGENSTIGANAFIIKSVPPNSKISGL